MNEATVQGIPLQTNEQIWAIADPTHGGYDPEMTCGCWESFIVSQSLGYAAVNGDMDTLKLKSYPKIIGKMTYWLRMLVLGGLATIFGPKPACEVPEVRRPHLLQGHKG